MFGPVAAAAAASPVATLASRAAPPHVMFSPFASGVAASGPSIGVPPPVSEAAAAVREQIATGQVNPFSAVAIMRAAARAGAGWETAEEVVAFVAKGADGIGGTADDLIPMATMAMLTSLLHNGVVRDLAAWALEVDSAPGAAPGAATDSATDSAPADRAADRAAARAATRAAKWGRQLCFWM